jgi:CheY-like chemotaxis protein
MPFMRSGRRASLLLVEDVARFRDDAVAALRQAGYEVVAVETASAALELIDGGLWIDLLVSRVLMPPGHPHGLALARMVKRRRPQTRVVLHAVAYDDLPRHERDNPPGLLIRRPNRGADLVSWVLLAHEDNEEAVRLGRLTLLTES